MGLFDIFKKKNDIVFTVPSKKYLRSLIRTSVQKFNNFEYIEIDENLYDLYYMATKKQSFIGLQLGLSEQARLSKHNIHESTKIRSNCMNYNKIFKKDKRIIKIEHIVNGRLDTTYLAYYENNYRYLFPYMRSGAQDISYLSVTHFEDDSVAEEYLVAREQIIYKKYGRQRGNKIDYYYINYVPKGTHPILEELRGYYLADSLELVEEEHSVWFQKNS